MADGKLFKFPLIIAPSVPSPKFSKSKKSCRMSLPYPPPPPMIIKKNLFKHLAWIMHITNKTTNERCTLSWKYKDLIVRNYFKRTFHEARNHADENTFLNISFFFSFIGGGVVTRSVIFLPCPYSSSSSSPPKRNLLESKLIQHTNRNEIRNGNAVISKMRKGRFIFGPQKWV